MNREAKASRSGTQALPFKSGEHVRQRAQSPVEQGVDERGEELVGRGGGRPVDVNGGRGVVVGWGSPHPALAGLPTGCKALGFDPAPLGGRALREKRACGGGVGRSVGFRWTEEENPREGVDHAGNEDF
jgi:hypothetical protein